MSAKVRFNLDDESIPIILEHIIQKIDESPEQTEILDSYLIDSDESRQSLLKILKLDCKESQRLYLAENFMYDNCPWVDINHMQSMWDHLGISKYDHSGNVFRKIIPYACIINYHSEKDIICRQIKKNKNFIISLKR